MGVREIKALHHAFAQAAVVGTPFGAGDSDPWFMGTL
jgi:hypothetical protein